MRNVLTSRDFYESLFQRLDITPSQYKAAEEHYNAVGKHLSKDSLCDDVYVQGSFALGTVIRPFRRGKDADYDLDIVCQSSTVPKEAIEPKALKHNVRDSILRSSHHAQLLDSNEGKRCWTLNYAPKDGVGFHMDILPCVGESSDIIQKIKSVGILPEYADNAIAITGKNKQTDHYGS